MAKTIADVIEEYGIPTMKQIGEARLKCVRCEAELTVFTIQCGPDGPLCHDCVDWNNYHKEGVMKAKPKKESVEHVEN